MRYLALLRAINVGGKNLVPMPTLRACFESLGLASVTTYIQSGNVLFESPLKSPASLTETIERALCAGPIQAARIVLLSQPKLARIVAHAPPQFGADLAAYRYDVAFLRPPLRAQRLVPTIELAHDVDQAFAGEGVLYFRKLIAKAGQSKLPKLVSHPAYREMTVRNWTTVTKLDQLLGTIAPQG